METELTGYLESITTNGFCKYKIENLTGIEEVKNSLASWLKERYSIKSTDSNYILNNIHKIAEFKNESEANQLTLDSISYLSNKFSFDSVIYESCRAFLTNLIGADIHSQKGNNIVVQHPMSKRNSELHIDAPPNSKFEIVCWLPLVDCFKTKSFYLVPLKDSLELINEYDEGKFPNWDQFKQASIEKSQQLDVQYGEVLFFSSRQLHGSEVNKTDETRWCLNARFKSLFAPCGTHDPLTYYRVLNVSPLTEIGFKE